VIKSAYHRNASLLSGVAQQPHKKFTCDYSAVCGTQLTFQLLLLVIPQSHTCNHRFRIIYHQLLFNAISEWDLKLLMHMSAYILTCSSYGWCCGY